METPYQRIAQSLVGTAVALGLGLSTLSGMAMAAEFDILTEATPTARYVLDDAGVLSKSTRGSLNSQLKDLEVRVFSEFLRSSLPGSNRISTGSGYCSKIGI